MSDHGIVEGWALPRGLAVPEVAHRDLGGGAVIAWPKLDAVAAIRLVDRLRGTRDALVARACRDVAAILGTVGARFLDPEDPLRREAIDAVTSEAGVSAGMADRIVSGMARDWTTPRLLRLLDEEFGGGDELDGFTDRGDRVVAAFGDAWSLHLVSGSVPGVAATSLIRSLLVKTPVLVKPGAGDVALTVLFARALSEADADLSDACAVAYWPGGEGDAEAVLLARADRVVVYGGDDTIASVRTRVAPATRIVEYGHRIGFSVVGPDDFDADALAEAVALFDQRGCVTTHHVFALGSRDRTSTVAAELAGALERLEARLPRGRLRGDEVSALRQRLETDELRAATSDRVEFRGGVNAGWAVIVEPDPGLEPGPGGRTVRVVTATRPEQIPADLDRMRLRLQTAGYGGFTDPVAITDLAERLGRVGVTRVVPFASVAFPPVWWLHDGAGPLSALVRRVELESEPPESGGRGD